MTDPPGAETFADTTNQPGQVVPAATPRRRDRIKLTLLVLWLRATLLVTPRPTTLMVRKLFAASAEKRAAIQLANAPADVTALIDERYGTGPDALMDLYLPAGAADSAGLPAIVWTHGGAFVGGTKDEIGGYLRMLAAHGFVVVGLRYTLAPEGRYPTPVRQVMAALAYLSEHAERYHLDPTRLVLAGDSAGSQITAQVAALITNPRYAGQLGIAPGIPPSAVRGVELCCGVYNLVDIPEHGPLRRVIKAIGWAYSGTRNFRSDAAFADSTSIPSHITGDFPPAFVTAGNGDPLLSQSVAMIGALRDHGVQVEALMYPADHEPRLPHEYQFELHLDDGRAAFRPPRRLRANPHGLIPLVDSTRPGLRSTDG